MGMTDKQLQEFALQHKSTLDQLQKYVVSYDEDPTQSQAEDILNKIKIKKAQAVQAQYQAQVAAQAAHNRNGITIQQLDYTKNKRIDVAIDTSKMGLEEESLHIIGASIFYNAVSNEGVIMQDQITPEDCHVERYRDEVRNQNFLLLYWRNDILIKTCLITKPHCLITNYFEPWHGQLTVTNERCNNILQEWYDCGTAEGMASWGWAV